MNKLKLMLNVEENLKFDFRDHWKIKLSPNTFFILHNIQVYVMYTQQKIEWYTCVINLSNKFQSKHLYALLYCMASLVLPYKYKHVNCRVYINW